MLCVLGQRLAYFPHNGSVQPGNPLVVAVMFTINDTLDVPPFTFCVVPVGLALGFVSEAPMFAPARSTLSDFFRSATADQERRAMEQPHAK
jgi:hypothetical protein